MTPNGSTASPAMRVVLWGTCDLSKPRVRILSDGLSRNGVEVIACHVNVWTDVRDKSQIDRRGWLRRLGSMLAAYPRLARQYWRLPAHDWVLLGYPSIPDIFVVRVLAWLRRTPVAMDWFLSAYDTVACDRRLVGRRHPFAVLLWLVEWCAVRLADRVFMDTRAHALRMERLFGLPTGTCGAVWVGAEDDAFPRAARPDRGRDGPQACRVLFYGQFIPLHGVPTIIEAARLLRDAPVEWQLVGTGQEAGRIKEMLHAQPLPRVKWTEWVDYHELSALISDADLCLGIFGTSDKAASVIPNKVFQVVATGGAVLTSDSPAIRELLSPTPGCCWLVPPGNAAALADAILQASSERASIGDSRCHDGIRAAITPDAIGAQLLRLLGSSRTGDTKR